LNDINAEIHLPFRLCQEGAQACSVISRSICEALDSCGAIFDAVPDHPGWYAARWEDPASFDEPRRWACCIEDWDHEQPYALALPMPMASPSSAAVCVSTAGTSHEPARYHRRHLGRRWGGAMPGEARAALSLPAAATCAQGSVQAKRDWARLARAIVERG